MVTRTASAPSLDISSLRKAYREGAQPEAVVEAVLDAIARGPAEGIWTHLQNAEDLRRQARELAKAYPRADLPLYGIPFAVKDSLDVTGVPTTLACPDFAYVADTTAPVVEKLRAAGALFVGKTNLDQFATGLVGVRSPYGIPPNPFDARYVTGGSSSGSAAAVARGQVSFSVATDTAGSGRVPAGFNNIVGLKPSRGLLSTTGLVPACRSIDCVTVLALTCEDATEVAAIASGFDPADPFSRREAGAFAWTAGKETTLQRVGVPREEDLVFGDSHAQAAFERACSGLEAMGLRIERVNMEPFYAAGKLLYGGPWIAERLSGLEDFVRARPLSLLPVIRTILTEGERYRATDAFRGIHRLAELKRAVEPIWTRLDALVVPTAPSHPRIDEVLADPLGENLRLGRYTTFANLLDLAAVAVPSTFRGDGLPSGITFLGPWGRDASLLRMAAMFHRRAGVLLGATPWSYPDEAPVGPQTAQGILPLAVVGAHLAGQPLNRQLTERGASLLKTTHTSKDYRLVAIPGTAPPKPGLIRLGKGLGARIEVEVWGMPVEQVGSFLAGIPSPLALGTIALDDGSMVHGFLCEAQAAENARDISSFGGWRAFLRSSDAP
jgi:allophanate hydrolase